MLESPGPFLVCRCYQNSGTFEARSSRAQTAMQKCRIALQTGNQLKPVLQSILLQHLSAQSLPRAPSSSAAPTAAAGQADLNGLKLEVLQDVKDFFEPRLQQVSQQAADLAAHNAVQGQVVEQLRVQLANAQAQLQATQAEVQGLSRAAAAAADAAATAGDREEIDRRATNLTVSNLTGVTSETEAAKVCGKLLQHVDGQTQPEIKLLRPSYADAARAGEFSFVILGFRI